jgi:hypothetical protein
LPNPHFPPRITRAAQILPFLYILLVRFTVAARVQDGAKMARCSPLVGKQT